MIFVVKCYHGSQSHNSLWILFYKAPILEMVARFLTSCMNIQFVCYHETIINDINSRR